MANIVKIPMAESTLHKPEPGTVKRQRPEGHLPSLAVPALPATDMTAPASNPAAHTDVAAAAPAVTAETTPVVIPPRFDAAYLNNPAPPYPAMARRKGEEGKVLLSVMVKTDGSPARIEVRKSSGSPSLDRSALDTVRHWRFVPARQGDKNIDSTVLVPLIFRLEG